MQAKPGVVVGHTMAPMQQGAGSPGSSLPPAPP